MHYLGLWDTSKSNAGYSHFLLDTFLVVLTLLYSDLHQSFRYIRIGWVSTRCQSGRHVFLEKGQPNIDTDQEANTTSTIDIDVLVECQIIYSEQQRLYTSRNW